MAKFRVLFAGADLHLWVTDGTSARTSQLTANVSATPDFTILGNKAVFEGADDNLWVTDGTSAGTSKLTVAGANRSALVPKDFTILGGKALFVGLDSSSHINLWVTDETSSGTSELAVTGAYSSGLFSNITDPSFKTFGS